MSDDLPAGLSLVARARVDAALREGCSRCEVPKPRVVQRIHTNHIRHVYLQCRNCGNALGQPLPIKECSGCDEYPLWDEDLSEIYFARMRRVQEIESQRKLDEFRQSHYFTYAEFLKSSEWRALTEKVKSRAGGKCEACLEAPATEVHHRTYRYGWFAPAFLLVAVCAVCHDRITEIDVQRLDDDLPEVGA